MNCIIHRNGFVNVTDCIAIEGGDVTTPLQHAVDYALHGGPNGGSLPAKVRIDLQQATLTGTIHVGYGDSFKGGHVEGLGVAYAGNAHVHVGTNLTSSVTDRPAISIQGARNTQVVDFHLTGVAGDAISAIDFENARLATDEAVWDAALANAGIAPGSRYAPHAAVAIDAYSGPVPAEPYPGEYWRNFGSNVTVRLGIRGFEVGIANQPCDADGNGDFSKFRDCTIERCKYGVSVGNSQARNTDLSGVNFNRVHTCIANNKHGRQVGKLGAHISNLHGAGFIYQIFDFNRMNWAGPLAFSNAYFESLFRIGTFSAPSSGAGSLMFDSSCFNFSEFDPPAHPGYVLAGASVNDRIEFRGCVFKPNRVVAFAQPHVTVPGSLCNHDTPPAKSYEALALNALMGGFVTNPAAALPQQAMMNVYHAGTAEVTATALADASFKHTGRDNAIPHALQAGRCPIDGEWSDKPIQAGVLSASKRLDIIRDGRAITFINAGISNIDKAYRSGALPGCVMVDPVSGTVMFVRSTDTATGETTVEMQNNYIADGEGGFDIFDPAFDPATGHWYLISGLVYSPGRMLWGTLTAGSNDITNVRSAGGVTLPNYGLVVGDRLAGELYRDQPFTGSVALEITGIDADAGTINVAGTAEFSAAHYPLPWWYRQPPANETNR